MIVMRGGTSCSWGVNCLLVQTPPKMMGGLKSGAVAVTENVSALRAPDEVQVISRLAFLLQPNRSFCRSACGNQSNIAVVNV